jgi:hypothetical protein
MATDKVEVTSFLDANKTYVQGLKDISGALSGFWEDSQDALFDAASRPRSTSTALRGWMHRSTSPSVAPSV